MVNPINPNINTSSIRSTTPSGSSRPTGEPSGSKNFEKVMKREDRNSKGEHSKDDKVGKKDEEGADDAESSEESSNTPKGKPSSIFDLSRASKPKIPTPQQTISPEISGEEAPSEELLVEMAENKMLSGKEKSPKELAAKPPIDSKNPAQTKEINPELAKSMAQPNDLESLKKESKEDRGSADDLAQTGQDISGSKRKNDAFDLSAEKMFKSKDKIRSEFSKEQPDMSSTDLHAQAQQQAPLVNPMGTAKAVEAPRDPRDLKDLIDQIVKEMYVVKTGEVTDTVMTIRHPPIFEGAQVKVTSFENARGQFNIAFENLSQQAKDLLDSRVNRESLLLALNKEGYNVHIITTSTTTETPAYIAQAQKRDQEQQGQGQGRQQQEQQKDQQKKKG